VWKHTNAFYEFHFPFQQIALNGTDEGILFPVTKDEEEEATKG